MRGYPPLQILVVLLFAMVIAWPLLHLTGKAGAEVSGPGRHEDLSVPTAVPRALMLSVRASAPPKSLKLMAEGRDLLAGQSIGGDPVVVEISLPVPPEGIEWHLQGEWAEGAPDAAVTVTVEPEGLEGRSETRWSSGAFLDEILVYLWRE